MTILDQWGRPLETGKLSTEQTTSATRAIRQRFALHPAAGLTPGKLANLLRDSIEGDPEAYLALAEDMEERDLHYAGVIGVRKRQVAGLEITVEPGDDSAAAKKAADLVQEFVDRPTLTDELVDILDAVSKGFSATEILWDRSGKEWGIKRLAWRDPRCFRFSQEDNETPLLRADHGDEPLNPFQWIFHVSKAKSGLPIRGGLARAVAWTFMFKSFTIKDWAIFTEAYGQPFRLGKYPAGTQPKDIDVLLDAVRNIGTDFAAVVPAGMTIEFLEATVTGSLELFEKRADWMDRQVSKVVLGQTATTDAIAGGHAVGKIHDEVREDIERADARQLGVTLTRDIATPLVRLNYGESVPVPRIKIGRPDETDVTALTENLAKLLPHGLRVSATEIRGKIGVGEPKAGEEVLGGKAKEADPVKSAGVEPDPAAALSALFGQPDDIDLAVADIIGGQGWVEAGPVLPPDLLDALSKATSQEEASAIIASMAERVDVESLRAFLAKAMLAAHVAGRFGQ